MMKTLVLNYLYIYIKVTLFNMNYDHELIFKLFNSMNAHICRIMTNTLDL